MSTRWSTAALYLANQAAWSGYSERTFSSGNAVLKSEAEGEAAWLRVRPRCVASGAFQVRPPDAAEGIAVLVAGIGSFTGATLDAGLLRGRSFAVDPAVQCMSSAARRRCEAHVRVRDAGDGAALGELFGGEHAGMAGARDLPRRGRDRCRAGRSGSSRRPRPRS